jgi:hypothetical protein
LRESNVREHGQHEFTTYSAAFDGPLKLGPDSLDQRRTCFGADAHEGGNRSCGPGYSELHKALRKPQLNIGRARYDLDVTEPRVAENSLQSLWMAQRERHG